MIHYIFLLSLFSLSTTSNTLNSKCLLSSLFLSFISIFFFSCLCFGVWGNSLLNSINFVLLLNLWCPEHQCCGLAVFQQFCFSALGQNMTVTLMSPCKLLSTCRKQGNEKKKKETWNIHCPMTGGITTTFIVWSPKWPSLLQCTAISL